MVEEFLGEVVIMRKFEHQRVMKLLGVTVHEDRPCIVLPLMTTDLKHHLRQNEMVCFATPMSCESQFLVELLFVWQWQTHLRGRPTYSFDLLVLRYCRSYLKRDSTHFHWELHMAWSTWLIRTLFIVTWLPETACEFSSVLGFSMGTKFYTPQVLFAGWIKS